MTYSLQNDSIAADFVLENGRFSVFLDDPSFVHCEKILVDMSQRNIGGILHEEYYHLGFLPPGINAAALVDIKKASLISKGERGREFRLNAPLEHIKEIY